MKKLWKKPVVKISAAAVIVVGFTLLGLWIRSLKPPPLMSFDFLKGQDITSHSENVSYSSHYRTIHRHYALAEDFNDICLSADAELLKLGYEPASYAGPNQREYTKHGKCGNSASVIIRRLKLTKYSKTNEPDYSSFYSDEHDYSEGWIRVHIFQTNIRLWPLQHLLYGLKMHWQASGQKKSRKDN